ncbi:spore coat protein [Serratia marcescens]|uniref:Spore coat protein n=1 Tax=Serratia marcescens TaxID=615 RepID=A0A1Q4NYD5_SERMA|nr:spore coat protein U domain-containing protein [Serratia marcescens]OKB65847.1 spore coat protein [Serratia marcescens]
MNWGIKTLMLGTLLLSGHQALANCAVTAGAVSLGSVTSNSIYSTSARAQGTGGLNCSGIGLTLLTENTVSVKIVSTTNSMYLSDTGGSGDKIPYLIYPDANYQYPFSAGQTINYNSLNLLSLIFVSSNVSIPLYIQTTTGANVRAGTYTDTINLSWTYSICYAGLLGACLAWTGTNVAGTVAVTATITKSCLIAPPGSVNFGSMALVGQFNPINQSINLTCTKTQAYNTYFTNGNNPVTGWRQMINGTSNFLQYQIYLPNTTTVWNSSNMQSGTGTGLAQSIPFTAAINPAQTEVPVGSYQDNVSFVVEY